MVEKTRPIFERVKEHVEESGLEYAEIAKRARWSEQRVYRLLHGKTSFRAEDMETLADILGKSVIALYRGKRAA